DGADDVVGVFLVRPQAGLAGADLVVAQAGDAVVGQQVGQLLHVPDGADDGVVTVAVGRPAFRDHQHRGRGAAALLMLVAAVGGQAVGLGADLVAAPRVVGRRAPGHGQHQRNSKDNNAFQRRTSIHDVTSSSTSARSG